MKNYPFLFLSVLISLLTVLSCGDDKPKISTDHENDVPENVRLLEYTNTSITMAWDFVEGAISYTVQLFNSPDSDQHLQIYTTSSEDDSYRFTGLSPQESYYARVRANFPNSAASKWIYIMDGDNYACVMPAYGIVNPDFEPAEVQLIANSSSTLTLTWSFTDFADMDSEIDHTFTLELFNDEECSDLHISWEEITGLFAASTSSSPSPLRFTFSGLESSKDYYARITDVTSNTRSRVYQFTTGVAAPAVAGDVILSQDFSKFIHGGDILYSAAGYTVGSGAGRTTWNPASGKNPVDESKGQAPCPLSTEFNVFDGGSVTVEYTEGVGMKDWGKHGNTSTRPGYIKIGGGSAGAALYTPELSSLTETSSVSVSLKAAMYKVSGTSYGEEILVQVVQGATFSGKGAINNKSSVNISSEQRVSIVDADGDFVSYEVTLDNVTPESRIVFSSDYAMASANKTRFLLDDIVIRKKTN